MVLSKYGEEHRDLSYTTSRSVGTRKFKENIEKYVKYMDPSVTTRETNVDKPKDFFKVAGSFHLLTFYWSMCRSALFMRDVLSRARCVNIRRCFLC